MSNDFIQAEAKLHHLVEARARELHPYFETMWSETDIGYEGGAFTREDALKEARESLRAGKTAQEWQEEKKASRRVLRTVFLSAEEDEAIRVAAFRSGKSHNDIMVELISDHLSEMVK